MAWANFTKSTIKQISDLFSSVGAALLTSSVSIEIAKEIIHSVKPLSISSLSDALKRSKKYKA